MAQNIFAGQGIFDDVRTPSGDKFQSLSGIDTTLEDVSDRDFQAQKSRFDATKRKQDEASRVKRARLSSDILGGVQTGLALGGQDTGETEFASTDSLIKILGGAGTGFLAGGPVGAIAGGLAGGLQAFLGTKANKRKQKAQKAKEARYQRALREQIAREDKFRKQERFDRLEEVGFNRSRQKMADQWSLYRDINKQFTDVINSNADLKKRFSKEGF